MCRFLQFCAILSILSVSIKCDRDMSLQINKKIENFFAPVTNLVEEKVGTTFSLICELVPSNNTSNNTLVLFDDNLSWYRGKGTPRMTPPKEKHKKLYAFRSSRSEINKSEKKFDPLALDDNGDYFCVSLKFDLYKNVQIVVQDDIKSDEPRPLRETSFCNSQMFTCMSNGVCINQHYVCDGKSDCKDGSDESEVKCNGNPCRDKIPCDDGRCIPTAWCCDRHHDLNCSVTNRPKCCQVLSESFEELEYGYPNVKETSHSRARYLFISVSIVSIAFSIVLLLLILSKVMIFAKKQVRMHRDIRFFQRIQFHYPEESGVLPSLDPEANGNSEVTERMVLPLNNDEPPSYLDVLRNSRSQCDPPPPYTSREILNIHD